MLQSVNFNNIRIQVRSDNRAKNNSKSHQILTIYPLPLRPILTAGIIRKKN